MPRNLMRPEGREDGAVLVWMALMMVVLLGVGALAVDLGYGYAVKRQLSSTSDAAALAGAQEAGLKFNSPSVGGCTTALQALVVTAANDNYTANHPQGSDGNPTVQMSCYTKDGTLVTPTATANPAPVTRVSVKVTSRSTLGTFLGRVFGVTSLKPSATATAQVFGSQVLTGLRPFLVCLNDAQAARDEYIDPSKTPSRYQSFYAKFAKTTETAPSGLVYDGATWDASTDEISKGNTSHGLDTGDYVRLENVAAAGPGVSNRFYYVEKTGPKTFKVKPSATGAAVNVTTSGLVDVFDYTDRQDALGSWSGSTVTSASHGFVEGTEVWVQVTLGDDTLDGRYTVDNVTSNTFELSAGAGSVSVPSTTSIRLYVLATANPDGGGDCNPATSPANWGYSAFDITNGDNQQLACLIKYGYGGDPSGSGSPPNGTECLDADPSVPGVDVGTEGNGVPAEGDQGNNLGSADGLLIKELIVRGDAILLPVGNGWNSLGGNNAEYDGRGALAVRLCGYVLPGNQVDQASPSLPTAANSYYFDPGCGEPNDYLAAVSAGRVTKDTSLVIQWYFREYVGSFVGQPSDPSSQCPLGQCIGQLQLTD